MQLQDIRTAVRNRAGVNANDAIANDASLTSLVNASLRQMANARDWNWLITAAAFSLAVDDESFAHAAGARVIQRVVLDGYSGSLKLVTPSFADNYSEFKGEPVFWFVQNGNIHVIPKAGKAYTGVYTYLAVETTLSGDTDEPLCPDYAIDWVIINAAKALAARMDNTSLYRLLDGESRRVLDTLVDDARKARPTPTIDSRRDWHV